MILFHNLVNISAQDQYQKVSDKNYTMWTKIKISSFIYILCGKNQSLIVQRYTAFIISKVFDFHGQLKLSSVNIFW